MRPDAGSDAAVAPDVLHADDARAGTDAAADGAVDSGVDPCLNHCDNHELDCGEVYIDCGGECVPCRPALEIQGRWLGVRGDDGQWRVGITTGQLRYSDTLFGLMVGSGKNLLNNNRLGAGGYGEDSAFAFVGGNLQNDFDATFWDGLRDILMEAETHNIGVVLNVWGTVALEWDAAGARWESNPWNASVGRGGPYDVAGCGKDDFYTYPTFGQVVYDPLDTYPAAADMHTRGQWLQERYIHRLATLCADFPHVAISLMWEASDLGDNNPSEVLCNTTADKVASWHHHLRDYIHTLSPGTLVATGTTAFRYDDFSGLDFLTSEAGARVNLSRWWTLAQPALPVVYTGWTAWNDADDCGKTCLDWDFVRARIEEAWAHGIQVGSPFWEYRNEDTYAVELDPYFLLLRQFLDTVQDWGDEPGDEVTLATLPP
jgi:hypothetical protein